MTMTLGFGTYDHLTRAMGDTGAREVLAVFAKHAPNGVSIRAGAYGEPYKVFECTRDGVVVEPADLADVQAAIAKAGYASWANDDAPEMLPRIILPGTGWDSNALLEEDAILRLCDADAFITEFMGTDQARGYASTGSAKKVLAAAEKHRLITIFR